MTDAEIQKWRKVLASYVNVPDRLVPIEARTLTALLAEVERLRGIVLRLVAAGGAVVLEDDAQGAAFTTIAPLATVLREARESLATTP